MLQSFSLSAYLIKWQNRWEKFGYKLRYYASRWKQSESTIWKVLQQKIVYFGLGRNRERERRSWAKICKRLVNFHVSIHAIFYLSFLPPDILIFHPRLIPSRLANNHVGKLYHLGEKLGKQPPFLAQLEKKNNPPTSMNSCCVRCLKDLPHHEWSDRASYRVIRAPRSIYKVSNSTLWAHLYASPRLDSLMDGKFNNPISSPFPPPKA